VTNAAGPGSHRPDRSARRQVALAVALALLAASVAVPWPALSQDPQASQDPQSAAGSPHPGTPAASAAASPLPDSADARGKPAFSDPTWTRLRPGRSPAAREDHTWTVDKDSAAAYLFGGRDGATIFDDLWRFDLATDTWARLRPGGARPNARFGHNAAWVPGTGLVIFAGQRGSEFFNDLWAYDPASERWTELPDRGAVPAPRYGSCAVLGTDGRLVISHGFTFRGRFDDTRAYDFPSGRWASVAPDGRRPGERCLHDCFTTTVGRLVLYGGQDDRNAALGDLWSTRPDGGWSRSPDPRAAARRLYAVTEAGPHAWIFGGAGRDSSALDDLWRVDRTTLEFSRVRPAGRTPPARWAGTLVTDPVRGRLLLFGGMARSALDDVWQLTDGGGAGAGPARTPGASNGPLDDLAETPRPGH